MLVDEKVLNNGNMSRIEVKEAMRLALGTFEPWHIRDEPNTSLWQLIILKLS